MAGLTTYHWFKHIGMMMSINLNHIINAPWCWTSSAVRVNESKLLQSLIYDTMIYVQCMFIFYVYYLNIDKILTHLTFRQTWGEVFHFNSWILYRKSLATSLVFPAPIQFRWTISATPRGHSSSPTLDLPFRWSLELWAARISPTPPRSQRAALPLQMAALMARTWKWPTGSRPNWQSVKNPTKTMENQGKPLASLVEQPHHSFITVPNLPISHTYSILRCFRHQLDSWTTLKRLEHPCYHCHSRRSVRTPLMHALPSKTGASSAIPAVNVHILQPATPK